MRDNILGPKVVRDVTSTTRLYFHVIEYINLNGLILLNYAQSRVEKDTMTLKNDMTTLRTIL